MTITTLDPHSTTQKTSLSYALAKGYTITPDGDGCAQVISPKSEVYHIYNWQCDCMDALSRNGGSFDLPDGRKVCKHVLWLSQLHPCDCGASMVLNVDTNWKAFVCTVCGSLKAFQQVKAQRQQAYRLAEQEADTIKTHQPIDTLFDTATEAPQATISNNPTHKPFTSRYGIDVQQDGDMWKVYCVGFLDSTHKTETEAEERATRLEVFEASHQDKRTRIHTA